jgi:L-glyceraldehyde 3-phosphate reductase
VLRDPVIASALIGASSTTQLDENLGALDNLNFSADELTAIDEYATDSAFNLWRVSSDL